MKFVRNAAKHSCACLVVCFESHFSELLLVSSHGEGFLGLRGLRISKTAFRGSSNGPLSGHQAAATAESRQCTVT